MSAKTLISEAIWTTTSAGFGEEGVGSDTRVAADDALTDHGGLARAIEDAGHARCRVLVHHAVRSTIGGGQSEAAGQAVTTACGVVARRFEFDLDRTPHVARAEEGMSPAWNRRSYSEAYRRR